MDVKAIFIKLDHCLTHSVASAFQASIFSSSLSFITFAGPWAAPQTSAAPSSGSSAHPAESWTLRTPAGPCHPPKWRHLSLGLERGSAWPRCWPLQAFGVTVSGIRCLWKAVKMKRTYRLQLCGTLLEGWAAWYLAMGHELFMSSSYT